MELYKKIRAYRKGCGLTQMYVAEQSGIELKKYNRLEMGRQRITTDDFEAICRKGLKVDPTVFHANDFLETKNKSGKEVV